MAESLEELKKQVFFDILNIAGRVFIAIAYGDDVIIGRRGFLPEEKEKGLVLVFNNKMKFSWDDFGISTTLVFGQTPEKCFIPHNRIISIFSPELNAQFNVVPDDNKVEEKKLEKPKAVKKPDTQSEKVIKVEFGKKK